MYQQEERESIIREKFTALESVLDERSRRLWAAPEAKALGDGGQTLVAKATGLARNPVHVGLQELEPTAAERTGDHTRVRRPGGGRKPLIEHDPLLVAPREALVEPTSRGAPQSPLRWTWQSTRQRATALPQQGHHGGRQKVAALLVDLG